MREIAESGVTTRVRTADDDRADVLSDDSDRANLSIRGELSTAKATEPADSTSEMITMRHTDEEIEWAAQRFEQLADELDPATAAAISDTTRLFVSPMKREEGTRTPLLALLDVFPWVRFLSDEDVRAFLVELVETADACVGMGDLAPLTPVMAAWRHTAEVHADPHLREALTEPLDGTDHGPVPNPAESGST